MKKLVLFIALIVMGLGAYSQDLLFTKGDVAPGQIRNGRVYEDFMNGYIKVSDNAGNAYSFVKADITVITREGKKLQYSLTKNLFTDEQSAAIIKAGNEGTTYTFTNIVVRDNNGKETTLPEVKYVFPASLKG